ncbi:hypothetical protein [Oceanispirochaeta sp.]|jgi:glycosyltransferase A (GT-A) superfamily protein (DUF2064 family)|uniref:DUF6951 family protein n=1 Tax=Oceanispirochaeta sp. TaxID=2035350 RepID=UPI002633FB70|nr:hypothetical protein [Oceanispirochaeta sp.]MDA3958876.1 hypothetical protein [Oceanispirochaeta sp.]
MIKTEICAGICGFNTTIRGTSEDGQNAVLEIQSDCPDIRAMAESLKETDAYAACFGPMTESPVYKLASEHCSHAACPVPSGIIKTLEAACNLALPADVTIKITKE